MSARRSIVISLGLSLLVAALAPRTARGQDVARWTVRHDPLVELWFDGLARAGLPRYGTFGLYATDVAPPAPASALARVAPALRAGVASDSAYDLLHFVPLWFVGERPEAVLAALHAALTPGTQPTVPRIAQRAAAVAGAFRTPAQRALVRDFVDALDEEWRTTPRPHGPGAAATTLATLQRRWNEELGPALSPFLVGTRRTDGVILPVAALGFEGRIVRPADGSRTIVAVARGAPGDTTAPLLAAVHELAFALLDRVPALEPAAANDGRDRFAAQRERDVAALRGGAMLLEQLAPGWVAPYRRLFSGGVETSAERFAQLFPLAPTTERALRAAIADVTARQPRTAPAGTH